MACKKQTACKADSSNGHRELVDTHDKKKPGGRGSFLDNSDLKLHASKDGAIIAHLTQVGMVQQPTLESNHLKQTNRGIADNRHPVAA